MSRTEFDSMGEVRLPDDALYGPQTQRARENFTISGQPLPWRFLRALIEIKRAAALTNQAIGELSADKAKAIIAAADRLLAKPPLKAFPVEVFQTGSGTSSNMNVNEVLAHLAGQQVHANDDVNRGQSSNDTVPAGLQLSVLLGFRERLLPALQRLCDQIQSRADELSLVAKTGRTHLMDALPLTLGQELTTWRVQLEAVANELKQLEARLAQLPLGGTAVGTGVNAHPELAAGSCRQLADRLGLPLVPHPWPFAHMAAQEAPLAASAALRQLAVVLLKIANDLRWMNSGPLAGLAEISLPPLQPGSSIMPGKVNPVIPEAVAMVGVQVMGLDSANALAAQSGNFQLNVMLPLLALNLNNMLDWLAAACEHLGDKAIAGFSVNREKLTEQLARNPVLITALNAEIGYQQAAAIAKKAYAEGRPILEVAVEETKLPRARLQELLDPGRLCHPKPD